MNFNEHGIEQSETSLNQKANYDTEMKQQTENLRINLLLEDFETVNTLLGYPEGRERDKFICAALKIGIQAIKNAQNKVDSTSIENEIEKMLAKLSDSQNQLTNNLTSTMREYLDPDKGRLNERIRRLVKKDGEIEVAFNSAIKQEIGKEFSLDNRDGVLKKLSETITNSNSAFTGDIKTLMNEITNDFSLDNENSALNRFFKNYDERTKKTMNDLMNILESESKKANDFRVNVVSQLEGMKARKKESYASTRHGHDFQLSAYTFIADFCQKTTDITEDVGSHPGMIKHCKAGDCVVTLGPDSYASGARIAVEMKQDKSFNLAKSLANIEKARKNRDAQIGLFIHSSRTAPDGIELLNRYGNDIVVVWDAEDTQTDVYLDAAIRLCKGLAIKISNSSDEADTDIKVIDQSIREIERQLKCLDEIIKSSSNIKISSEKITKQADGMREVIRQQIDALDHQSLSMKKHSY